MREKRSMPSWRNMCGRSMKIQFSASKSPSRRHQSRTPEKDACLPHEMQRVQNGVALDDKSAVELVEIAVS
jgi:hypothetical protein